MTTAGLLLACAVALIASPRPRRAGAAALGALALGVAADRLVPAAGAPTSYAAVTAGLVLVGWLVPLGAVGIAAWRDRHGSVPALLLGVVSAVIGGAAAVGVVRAAGAPRAGAAAAALLAAGLLAAAAGRLVRLPAAFRRTARLVPEPSSPAPLAAVVLLLLAAAMIHHLGVVLLAPMLGVWAAWLAIPSHGRPWPLAAAVATLCLAPALVLLVTISGPEGLGLAAIPWLPISPAAERLLGLLLLGAVVACGGSWPLRQPLDGLLTAPFAALLLVRVALPAVPLGLAHWRAAAFPLVVLGLWHAAATRRIPALAVGGALLGLCSLQQNGVAGAGWLLACAVGVRLSGERVGPLPRLILAAAGYWGTLQVIGAGLATELVYTVIGVLAAAVGLATSGRAAQVGAQAALTPPPGGSIFGREMI